MDTNRFDEFSKRLVSRRQALGYSATGIAVGALAAVGFARTAAQEATPPATPTDEEVEANLLAGSTAMLGLALSQPGSAQPTSGPISISVVPVATGSGFEVECTPTFTGASTPIAGSNEWFGSEEYLKCTILAGALTSFYGCGCDSTSTGVGCSCPAG